MSGYIGKKVAGEWLLVKQPQNGRSSHTVGEELLGLVTVLFEPFYKV